MATTSILLRSPSPSPSPASTPLPALQPDLSSSSSSSASGSCLDLHRSSSAPSTRRIRFAPLPEPRRDDFDSHDPSDDPQFDPKPASHPPPIPDDIPDGVIPLSPTVSLDSTLSSARSTPTIRVSSSHKPNMKLFRLSFLRGSRTSSPSQSPLPPSAPLPGPSSLPGSPSSHSAKLPRFSTEDILSMGTKSLFRSRSRSGSTNSARSPRPLSPPPSSSPSSSLHRSASTGSGPSITVGTAPRDQEVSPNQSRATTVSVATPGTKKRRASSSALTPGAGGGRHACSNKIPSDNPTRRPSTAPSSPVVAPKRHVKMLNGRVYGAKRYAAQTLANPFANVRDEPEFVEWGYGGMGSVHASAGIANDMWKGLQRSERGGALFAGSSGVPDSTLSSPGTLSVGGGRGSGARPTSPIVRRKMSDNVPECGMGNVSGMDDDDGSGMAWLKRRRAEKEAKARLGQQAKELQKTPQEGRKSGDSMDASLYASTASTTTSLTVATSTASTNLTTPATSPLTSRSPSVVDLNVTSPDSPPAESRIISELAQKSLPKDDHEHHVLTAIRLSPNIVTLSHKNTLSSGHGRTASLSHTLSQIGKDTDHGADFEQVVPLSPVDTEETTTSAGSFSDEDDEEPSRGSDKGEEQDGVDDDEVDNVEVRRKTALGAGVEKISRHVDAEAR